MQFKFAAAAAVERMYLLILFVCPGNWLLLQCLWLNFERTKGKESKIIIIKKKKSRQKGRKQQRKRTKEREEAKKKKQQQQQQQQKNGIEMK